MRVEIVKPVVYGGVLTRSGTLDVPESVARHWVSVGAAKEPGNPPAPAPAAAAERGKRF